MKKLLAVVVAGTLASSFSLYALPDYEPFADASGSGGTTYAPGANLGGQVTAQGLTWAEVGTSASGSMKITSGSLSISGLAPSQGNSVTFGGNGRGARLGIGSSLTTGTLFFSFIVDITSTNGMSTSGVFWAGLNNSTGVQSGQPTVVGDKIFTRLASDGFEFGFAKNSTAATSVVWDTTIHYANEVNFLVGSYTFGSTSSLWIDPSSSTFGDNGLTPAATLTSVAGDSADISALASWLFAQRSASEPAAIQADELRLGADWASVTPGVPEPSSFALAGLGLLALLPRLKSARR